MMNWRIRICGPLVSLTVFAMMLLPVSSPVALEGVSLERSIEIAREETSRLGLDVAHLAFETDETNSRWHAHLQSTGHGYPEIQAKLIGRDYLAVYVFRKAKPRVLMGGGDLFVFIDKRTGTAIGVLRFK